MASNVENPFAAPRVLGGGQFIQPAAAQLRSQFCYVIGAILAMACLLALVIVPRLGVSPEAGLLFFGVLLIGPFSVTLHDPWTYSSPQFAVGVFICLATFLYLLIPRRSTLLLSMAAAAMWVLYGAFVAFEIYFLKSG